MALAPVFVLSFALHALIGWRIAHDLASQHSAFGWVLWLTLTASAILTPLGLLARRLTHGQESPWLTWLGLICMGLFSSLLVFTLVREVALAALWLLDLAAPGAVPLAAWRVDSALALPPLAALATLIGLWNARRTATVVQVDVPVANLPPALHGFTVVQISDIHVGPTIKASYLQRIVDRVNALQAHMVAITGDLVDGSVQELGTQVQPLSQLRSTHGTFFVTGNHEYYSGAHGWIATLRALGVRVLMNEHVLIEHSTDTQDPEPAMVVVAGVTDYSAHHFDESHRSDPHKAIAQAPDQAVFKLLLAHQPRSAAQAADAGFDLQLSGHTHGGQFWPWNHFVRLQQPFTAGLHKLRDLWVYTSRGTGYWGPPKRLGAPSEITYLRLVPAPVRPA